MNATNKNFLPPHYGLTLKTSCDVKRARIGIVVPVFGRSQYLRKMIASLQQSDLKDCVVCFVDETQSSMATDACNGYQVFSNIDSTGGDLEVVKGGLNQFFEAANSNTKCIAFNSCGWLKYRLNFWLRHTPGNKLYIRQDFLSTKPWLKRRLDKISNKKQPDFKATEILLNTILPNTPVIKIFKSQHAHMFDSYAKAWRLLLDRFHCDYLVALDSDTIVKPDWLSRLTELHTRVSTKDGKPILITGFHTKAHPVLKDEADYRIKKSVGGINLLFSSKWFEPLVEPCLTSLRWDFALSEKINEAGGTIVCSKPSVVEHIGRYGVWSGLFRFDQAVDF